MTRSEFLSGQKFFRMEMKGITFQYTETMGGELTCFESDFLICRYVIDEITEESFKIYLNGFQPSEYYFDDFELCK